MQSLLEKIENNYRSFGKHDLLMFTVVVLADKTIDDDGGVVRRFYRPGFKDEFDELYDSGEVYDFIKTNIEDDIEKYGDFIIQYYFKKTLETIVK